MGNRWKREAIRQSRADYRRPAPASDGPRRYCSPTEGAAVTVVDISDDGGHETVAQIERNGGRGLFVRADVAIASEVEGAIEATVRQFGRFDILHNNAFWTIPRSVLETTEEEWDRTLAVCLKGTVPGRQVRDTAYAEKRCRRDHQYGVGARN